LRCGEAKKRRASDVRALNENKIDGRIFLSQRLNLSTPELLILGFAMSGSFSILEG
jgi:hypothetical protein